MFQLNPLLGRGFTRNIKPYFFFERYSKILKCRLLQFLFGALRVKSRLHFRRYMPRAPSLLDRVLAAHQRSYGFGDTYPNYFPNPIYQGIWAGKDVVSEWWSAVVSPYQTCKTVHVHAKDSTNEVMCLIWFVPRDCGLTKQAQEGRYLSTRKSQKVFLL